MTDKTQLTQLLNQWRTGDPALLAQIMPAVYDELHRVAQGYMRGQPHHRAYFTYLQLTVAAAAGAVLATDLIALLVFWGILAVTLYLMILISGEDAAQAARKSLTTVAGRGCSPQCGQHFVVESNAANRGHSLKISSRTCNTIA